MPREYRPQIGRENPRKPSVVRGIFHGWQTRGYDQHNVFYQRTVDTWPQALDIAIDWARDGYPEEAAA